MAAKKHAKKVARHIDPLSLSDTIRVLKKDNPFREGSEVFKRVNAVLSCNGKSVGAAVKKGARTSTVRWARKNKVVRTVTA